LDKERTEAEAILNRPEKTPATPATRAAIFKFAVCYQVVQAGRMCWLILRRSCRLTCKWYPVKARIEIPKGQLQFKPLSDQRKKRDDADLSLVRRMETSPRFFNFPHIGGLKEQRRIPRIISFQSKIVSEYVPAVFARGSS